MGPTWPRWPSCAASRRPRSSTATPRPSCASCSDGFAPGFAYLGDLPAELHVPRLDTPRTRTPAGLGGDRGVDERHLSGRPAGRLAGHRPHAGRPCSTRVATRRAYLVPGDACVRADRRRVGVPRGAPDRLVNRDRRAGAADHRSRIPSAGSAGGTSACRSAAPPTRGARASRTGWSATLTTRRCSRSRSAVPRSGSDGPHVVAADRRAATRRSTASRSRRRGAPAARRARRSASSPATARAATWRSAAGSWSSAVLGSASTDLRTGFGGLEGRALRAGDRLEVGTPTRPAPRALDRRAEAGPIRIVAGPHPERARRALIGATWTVGVEADRTGVRLDGTARRRRARCRRWACRSAPSRCRPTADRSSCSPTAR